MYTHICYLLQYLKDIVLIYPLAIKRIINCIGSAFYSVLAVPHFKLFVYFQLYVLFSGVNARLL